MYYVGLTGTIGSGKSTVISCFRALGVAVIIADNIAKELTAVNLPAFTAIKTYFGEQVIDSKGELNRPLLRNLIFSNPKHRLWLEQLLHPLIKDEIKKQALLSTSPYCVIEIPLLLKRQDYPYLDRILLIVAEKNTQIQRVMARDNCEKSDALKILASQPDESVRRKLADDIIMNNRSVEKLNLLIRKLHDKYLHFAVEKFS